MRRLIDWTPDPTGTARYAPPFKAGLVLFGWIVLALWEIALGVWLRNGGSQR